ncbi:PqqD family protein [Novosphingobium beihaiensis]|uniref:PqqD family protein n=1 Tax=Novosphingobium beihaiensis TaxID=2930389 RepID=A0ABT0BWG0_9SPHN|nr:PqqD family protein [Novosphingobium beihaiensis]MCJ2189228.1 PqqD family protein [Novosphingobium beihaiensis]
MNAVRKIGNWLEADVDNETMMMNTESGMFVSLNRTARFLWKCLDEVQSTEALLQKTIENFNVTPEQAEIDIAACLKILQEEEAIIISVA